MSACREGFNLFNRFGRQHLKDHIARGRWRNAARYVFVDTFGHPLCWLAGHKPYRANSECDPPEFACRRCHRWLRGEAGGEKG